MKNATAPAISPRTPAARIAVNRAIADRAVAECDLFGYCEAMSRVDAAEKDAAAHIGNLIAETLRSVAA